jgi:hypothetical protein
VNSCERDMAIVGYYCRRLFTDLVRVASFILPSMVACGIFGVTGELGPRARMFVFRVVEIH